MNVEENIYTHKIKHIFVPALLQLFTLYHMHAACPHLVTTTTFFQPTVHFQSITMPPQFTDIKVDCNILADTFCATSLNVTGSTVVCDTTTPGEYTNLTNYNFLRSNRSMFPTFDNDTAFPVTFGNKAS